MQIDFESSPKRLPTRQNIKNGRIVDLCDHKYDRRVTYYTYMERFLERHVGMGLKRTQQEFHRQFPKKYPHIRYIWDMTPDAYLLYMLSDRYYNTYYVDNGIIRKKERKWTSHSKTYRVHSDTPSHYVFDKWYVESRYEFKLFLIGALGYTVWHRLLYGPNEIPVPLYTRIMCHAPLWHIETEMKKYYPPYIQDGFRGLFKPVYPVDREIKKTSTEYKKIYSEAEDQRKKNRRENLRKREEYRSTLLENVEANRRNKIQSTDDKKED